jgi:hypothetical protein
MNQIGLSTVYTWKLYKETIPCSYLKQAKMSFFSYTKISRRAEQILPGVGKGLVRVGGGEEMGK